MNGDNAWRLIKQIEGEASERKRKGGSDAYSLTIWLKSGRKIEGDPFAADNHAWLPFNQKISPAGDYHKTYIPYDAIEQVTPIWH